MSICVALQYCGLRNYTGLIYWSYFAVAYHIILIITRAHAYSPDIHDCTHSTVYHIVPKNRARDFWLSSVITQSILIVSSYNFQGSKLRYLGNHVSNFIEIGPAYGYIICLPTRCVYIISKGHHYICFDISWKITYVKFDFGGPGPKWSFVHQFLDEMNLACRRKVDAEE